MEEINGVVTENKEEQYQNKSILRALYAISGPSGIRQREQNQSFSNSIVHQKLKTLDRDLHGRSQVTSYGRLSL